MEFLALGRQRQEDPWSLLGRQSSQSASYKFIEKLSQTIWRAWIGKDLSGLHTHERVPRHACKHTHWYYKHITTHINKNFNRRKENSGVEDRLDGWLGSGEWSFVAVRARCQKRPLEQATLKELPLRKALRELRILGANEGEETQSPSCTFPNVLPVAEWVAIPQYRTLPETNLICVSLVLCFGFDLIWV